MDFSGEVLPGQGLTNELAPCINPPTGRGAQGARIWNEVPYNAHSTRQMGTGCERKMKKQQKRKEEKGRKSPAGVPSEGGQFFLFPLQTLPKGVKYREE